MWQLWHYLFGWHYTVFHWGFGDKSVCRVKQAPNGRPYITWCGTVYFLDEPDRKYTPLTYEEEQHRIA